jgi:hypothetical protein
VKALTLTEAIEFTLIGVELEQAFRALDALPTGSQRKGDPIYDRWRKLALRWGALQPKGDA